MNKYSLLYAVLCVLPMQLRCASHDLQSLLDQHTQENSAQESRRKTLIQKIQKEEAHCCFPPRIPTTRELYYAEGPWDGDEVQCSVQNYVRMRREGCTLPDLFVCTSALSSGTCMAILGVIFGCNSPYVVSGAACPFLSAACIYPCAYHDEDVSNPNNWQNGKYKPTQITMPEETT